MAEETRWTTCQGKNGCPEKGKTVIPVKTAGGFSCPACGELTSGGTIGPYTTGKVETKVIKETGVTLSKEAQDVIQHLKSISTGLLGYEKVTRAMTVCAVAGENLMLLGSRGGAKSMQARLFFKHFEGCKFEAQFSKFADESVLFGNPDVKEMKETGKIVYPKDQGLAAAHWALFDEFPDGNWMLHRACNAPLNERKVIRGNEGGFDIPLQMVVATGNYAMQSDEKMEAVIDRFAFYVPSPKLKGTERELLYDGHCFENPPEPKHIIPLSALKELRAMAENVKIPKSLAIAFIGFADQQGFSPRRERKMAKILKIHAAMHSRTNVGVDDIAILEYIIPFVKIGGSGDNPALQMQQSIERAAVAEEQMALIDLMKKEVDPAARKDTYAKALAKAIRAIRTVTPADERVGTYQKGVLDGLQTEHQKTLQALELLI